MTWFRRLAPVLLGLGVLGVVASGGSCASELGPQLVSVVDVQPRQVELGDHLVIAGQGFPAGQVARVVFDGALHRPGERVVEGAQVVLAGSVTAPDQVEVVFGDQAQALFCGAADRARHTTFEGSVQVAFAAARPGAPPVAGLLPRTTLDVRPSGRPTDASGEREGTRLLAWVGVRATPAAAGLLVQGVESGSRGQAAGLEPGDVLVSFDGVRVATAADLLPAPGEREATLGLRRAAWAGRGGVSASAGDDVVSRALSVEGFRGAPARELLGAALVVFAALAVVLLFGARNGIMRSVLLQRVASRLGARLRAVPGAGPLPAKLLRLLMAAARDVLPPAAAPAIVDTLACGLLAALPFGQYLIAAQFDVALLLVAAVAVAAGAAFVAGGSSWRGARAALAAVWHHAPAAAAVACVVVTTGSMRVQEIERAQGGWPWDWLAFRNPAVLVALGLLLACATADSERAGAPPGSVQAWVEDDAARATVGTADGLSARRPARGPWLAAACRAHGILVAGLASVLFLGGWLLPGLAPAEQDARPALELAGAAWLLAKTWGVATLLAWARWSLPPWRVAERTRATALWLAPLGVAALAATLLWTWWGPAPAAQLLVSGALVAVVSLVALAAAVRLRHGLVAAGERMERLSPFL
jgi:NADH-quinone oxidoreductase subunit H